MKFCPSYQTKLKRQNKLKIHKKKICLERLIQDWACLRHFEETEQYNEVQILKCLHCQAFVGWYPAQNHRMDKQCTALKEVTQLIELSGVILYARALLFCLCFTGVLIICAVFPEYIITLRARSTKKLTFMCTKQVPGQQSKLTSEVKSHWSEDSDQWKTFSDAQSIHGNGRFSSYA